MTTSTLVAFWITPVSYLSYLRDSDDTKISSITNFLFCGIGNQVHVFHRSGLETTVIRAPLFAPGLAIHGYSSVFHLVPILKCSNSTASTQHLISVHASRAVSILPFDLVGHKSSHSSNIHPVLDVDRSNGTQILMLRVCAVHMFDNWMWHVEWIMDHYHNKMSDINSRNYCDMTNAKMSSQTSSSPSSSLSS